MSVPLPSMSTDESVKVFTLLLSCDWVAFTVVTVDWGGVPVSAILLSATSLALSTASPDPTPEPETSLSLRSPLVRLVALGSLKSSPSRGSGALRLSCGPESGSTENRLAYCELVRTDGL